MNTNQILWLDLQPSLYCLFKRTAQTLGQHFKIRRWSFEHDLDESCDVDIVHSLLRHTIENSSTPVHLIGHGISGTIAYLYALKYPNDISSVSVLSVDTHSANQWTSHYQSMRSQLPCSRFHILSHLSRMLVDKQTEQVSNILTRLLVKCLDNDFVYGSIVKSQSIMNLNQAEIPILVINGEKDFVVDKQSYDRWKQILKPGDCYQKIANGRHFFPFTEWSQTAKIIKSFVEMVPDKDHNHIPEHYGNPSLSKLNS
jgi:pimeloyl-ACP methyl ester carboxylesterase